MYLTNVPSLNKSFCELNLIILNLSKWKFVVLVRLWKT